MSKTYKIYYSDLNGGKNDKPCDDIEDNTENKVFSKIRCLSIQYGSKSKQLKRYIKNILKNKDHPGYEILRKPILISKLNKIMLMI